MTPYFSVRPLVAFPERLANGDYTEPPVIRNGPVELSRGSAATPRSARTGGYAFDLVITQLRFSLVSDSTHMDHPS